MTHLESLARRGNLQLAQAEGRRFPGLLIQGDTLRTLLDDLEEEAPTSVAAERLADWVAAYEEMMREVGRRLPY
ncbi:DUF6959 family protein [Streptomyces alfalfae]|uniref:DUF6959 family protein n=1 Tax=Streptomyces alfalfae TaxID=1642299 RepID=UPI002811E35F|nr:hypothetical protein [Streptomyces alfalfae]